MEISANCNRDKNQSARSFLKYYFSFLALLLAVGVFIIIPYSFLWLYLDGDLALERVLEKQAHGSFAIFGSGVSQNFMEYKLELYKNIRPEICAVGSSRVMQFRGAWFNAPFANMGGAAGNLAELRFVLEEMLKISPPKGIIIGLDFWWFMPQWEKEPLKKLEWRPGSYEYELNKLKKPWQWLLEGKISFEDILKPLQGSFKTGFNPNRFGIMAQKYNEGFGPDGSWYNTAEITGKKPPFDYLFHDTLQQIENGIKAFYRAEKNQAGPSGEHVFALLEILAQLKEKNVEFWLFIPPLSQRAHDDLAKNRDFWPHLFNLRKTLQEKGLEVLDFSSPKNLEASDCEFIDGFHGGEIAYARILSRLALENPDLARFVNLEKLHILITDWRGFAMSFNENVTSDPEIDFNHFGCVKKIKAK